jgi:hypothetical protein
MTQAPRRLSDKLLTAFDQACEQGQIDVAEIVLHALELVLTKEVSAGFADRRVHMEPAVEAFGRLKALKDKVVAHPRSGF